MKPLTVVRGDCSLDGHPLQIKQLRGEEPVESINLSGKVLTTLSAIVIAAHLRLRQELLAGLILWGAGRLDWEGGLCQLCAPSRTVVVTHSVGTGRIAPASNHPAVLPSQDPTKPYFAGSSA